MVDTGDLKSPGLTAVPVRVRPRANQTAMKAGPLNDLGYLLFKGLQAFIVLNRFIFLQVIASTNRLEIIAFYKTLSCLIAR